METLAVVNFLLALFLGYAIKRVCDKNNLRFK